MDKIVIDLREPKGINFFCLCLLAFVGLGIEVLLAFFIEPILYGKQMENWSTWQYIMHWSITCIIWGIIVVSINKYAKKKYSFDLFEKPKKMKIWQWAVVIIMMLLLFLNSYIGWNGFKVVKEFESLGWLKFIFQCLYYIFETALFTFIIIFGQKAFEKWFKHPNIPYGGIVVAFTWGLVHMLTKGDIGAGIMGAIVGFVFGVVYSLVNKDAKKTFALLFLMFVM